MQALKPARLLSMKVSEIAELSVAEILSVLIQIPSVNPNWQSEKSNVASELAKARFFFNLFIKLEDYAECEIEYVESNRPNVMLRITVDQTQEYCVWDTHIDTVGVDNMSIDPFAGTIDNTFVWGRGACDTLASAAVAIKLLFFGKANSIRPIKNILFVFTSGEENGGLGAKALNKWILRNGIVATEWITSEPTELQAVFAHNGLIRGGLEVSLVASESMSFEDYATFLITGRSGHTCNPNDSENALYLAAQFLESASALGITLLELNAGGHGNIIPGNCHLKLAWPKGIFTSRDDAISNLLTRHRGSIRLIDQQEHTSEQTLLCLPSYLPGLILTFEKIHRELDLADFRAVTGKPVISLTGVSHQQHSLAIYFDRRVVPGENPQFVLKDIIERIRKCLPKDTELRIIDGMREHSGFETNQESALINRLSSLSKRPATTAQYGTNLLHIDQSVFKNGEIVAAVFGPGSIAQAHTKDEHIRISELDTMYSIMTQFFGFN